MTRGSPPPILFRREDVTLDTLRRIFEAHGWRVDQRRSDLTVHLGGAEIVFVIVPPSILITTEFHAPPTVSRGDLIEAMHQFNLDQAYGRAMVIEYMDGGGLGVVFHTDHAIDGGLIAQNIVGKCVRLANLVKEGRRLQAL